MDWSTSSRSPPDPLPVLLRHPTSFVLMLLTTEMFKHVQKQIEQYNFPHIPHPTCTIIIWHVWYIPSFTLWLKCKSPFKHLAIHLWDICYVPMSTLSHFFGIYHLWNIQQVYSALVMKNHWTLEALAISSALPSSQRWGAICMNSSTPHKK